VEEVELRPEAAVVALPRLLEPLQVCVEVVLRVERGAVDPRQLRVVLVAAPVRAGDPRQLDRLDRARVLEMRPFAEVGEVALRVEGDRALGGVNELDLVRLPFRLEPPPGFVRGNLLAPPAPPFVELASQLGLDRGEVLFADRLGELEVVVEAVLGRRADRELDVRVETAHRLREQVRGRMPQHRERVRVLPVSRRQDLDPLAVLERLAQVEHAAVRADEDRLLGELRADRARRLEAGRALRQLELGLVGKDDLHRRSTLPNGLPKVAPATILSRHTSGRRRRGFLFRRRMATPFRPRCGRPRPWRRGTRSR
jgi:hypothetical protein